MTAEGWRVSAQRIALDSIFKTAKAQVILSRHCERSEAIHFAATQEAGLLCRCSPCNDAAVETRPRFRGARGARVLHEAFPQENRGRGESRVPAAPAASR